MRSRLGARAVLAVKIAVNRRGRNTSREVVLNRETIESVSRLDSMRVEPGSVEALVVLIVTTGIMVRVVMGGWGKRSSRTSTEKIAQLEERVQKIEEATSTIVAEFAAVREREQFLRRLVESKSRKSAETPAAAPTNAPIDTTPPFVVQTVSAARRT